jgi:hypothetical protein
MHAVRGGCTFVKTMRSISTGAHMLPSPAPRVIATGRYVP